MAYRRRRSTRGRRCTRYKRVRVKGQGMARRCAKFSGGRSYRRRSTRRRRKPTGMARRGSRCVRFKRVKMRGVRGTVRRCAKYRAR